MPDSHILQPVLRNQKSINMAMQTPAAPVQPATKPATRSLATPPSMTAPSSVHTEANFCRPQRRYNLSYCKELPAKHQAACIATAQSVFVQCGDAAQQGRPEPGPTARQMTAIAAQRARDEATVADRIAQGAPARRRQHTCASVNAAIAQQEKRCANIEHMCKQRRHNASCQASGATCKDRLERLQNALTGCRQLR